MDKPEKKAKMGRPLVVIDWDSFDALCYAQCTKWEISAYFKTSEDTLERAVKREKGVTFAVYFDEKRNKGLVSLRRQQFQVAMKGSPAMLIWLGKQYLGQKEKHEHTGDNGGPIRTSVVADEFDLTKLTDDELYNLRNLVEKGSAEGKELIEEPSEPGPTEPGVSDSLTS